MVGQGTLPFETIAGQLAAVDYIASLGTRFGTNKIDEVDTSVDKRAALKEGFGVIAAHEAALAQQFVSGLDGEILFADSPVALQLWFRHFFISRLGAIRYNFRL